MTHILALTCAVPVRKANVDDLIDPTAAELPANVLEVQGRTGEMWQRATGDDRYDEDGAEYDWVSDGWLASEDGVLSCGPLRVTEVTP